MQCRIKLVGGPGPVKILKSNRPKAKPRQRPNGAAGDIFFLLSLESTNKDFKIKNIQIFLSLKMAFSNGFFN
jgi:hypothetical protein